MRKLRWLRSGMGKRGGSRVIYYFHNVETPIFLFTMFAKSVRVDLSPAERRELRHVVSEIVKSYGGKP